MCAASRLVGPPGLACGWCCSLHHRLYCLLRSSWPHHACLLALPPPLCSDHVHILECHPTDPSLAFSASYDGTLALWNLHSGAVLRRFTRCEARARGQVATAEQRWMQTTVLLPAQRRMLGVLCAHSCNLTCPICSRQTRPDGRSWPDLLPLSDGHFSPDGASITVSGERAGPHGTVRVASSHRVASGSLPASAPASSLSQYLSQYLSTPSLQMWPARCTSTRWVHAAPCWRVRRTTSSSRQARSQEGGKGGEGSRERPGG